MAFETFGKLQDGRFFRWRGKIWVKVPFATLDNKNFNAYTTYENDKEKVSTAVVDGATLVNLNTGISEERQKNHLALFTQGDKT